MCCVLCGLWNQFTASFLLVLLMSIDEPTHLLLLTFHNFPTAASQDSGQIFHHRSQLARSSVSRKSPEKKRGGSEPLVRAVRDDQQ